MAVNRLSTDSSLLSPIQSDFSLNESSAFSLSSLNETPHSRNHLKEMDLESNLEVFTKANMSPFKKVSHKNFNNISHKTEKMSKDSKGPNKSLDDEFCSTQSVSNIPSPIFKCSKVLREKATGEESKESEKSNAEHFEKTLNLDKAHKSEKTKMSKENDDKGQCATSKHLPVLKESKSQNTYVENGTSTEKLRQKQTEISSTPCEAFNTGNKGLSLQTSIKIAVGMELDELRWLLLDNNIRYNRELHKLKEMARRHQQRTEGLLKIVEDFVEANKQLTAKHFKSPGVEN